MDRRRHYGRKIKKTRNLYRKKKSAGQKVFGTVMLVIAVSAIAFLGFCIGKPLLDYIGGIGKEDTAEWTPEASYAASLNTPTDGDDTAHDVSAETDLNGTQTGVPAVSEDTDGLQTTTAASSDAQQTVGTNQPHSTTTHTASTETSLLIPSGYDTLNAFEAPASALANRSSLSAVLAKAKSGGYNSVVIQLKDRNGYFHYKSGIEGVADSVLDAGAMTLDEIMSVFGENGLVPIAEIAVLSDEKGCEMFTDMSYKCIDSPSTSWLDYSISPPKRWANPESDATREYFAKVTGELVSAGFENILLTDVIFPNFQHYDTAYIAAKYFDPGRYKLLHNVIKAGNMIEMKASDIIGETYGRTAEALTDISQLHDNSVAMIISRSDLPTDSGYPADAKTLVETILSLAEKKTGGLKIVPVIDGSGFDDADKAKIVSTLVSLGYDSYIMR